MIAVQTQARNTLDFSTPSASLATPEIRAPAGTLSYLDHYRTRQQSRALGEHGAALPVNEPPAAPAANFMGWLSELYSLVGAKKSQKAGILLYDRMDQLLTDGRFAECDEILKTVRFDMLGPLHTVGFLTITSGYRHQLKERSTYYRKVERQVRLELPDRADRILVGLE